MAPIKLLINPEQASYNVSYGEATLVVGVEGGSGKYRANIDDPSNLVNCKWVMGKGEFDYFRAFFRTATDKASTPFLIDLIMDDSDLTEHTAHFVPSSYRLTAQRGLMYEVTCTVEAIPTITDADFDNGILMTFEAYGSLEAGNEVYDLLEIFVNITYPGAVS